MIHRGRGRKNSDSSIGGMTSRLRLKRTRRLNADEINLMRW